MSLLSGPTGLLGQGFDDPRSAAVMALAGGLLQRNMGGGLLAANNAYGEAKQNAAKQRYMDMQMQAMQAEIDQRKQAALKQAEGMAMLKNLLGGGAPSYQQGQLGSGTMGIVPNANPMAPARPTGGLANATPEQIAMAKMYGLDLTEPWKVAKQGFAFKPGEYRMDPATNQSKYIGDPTKGITMQDGRVGLMPGFLETQGAITMATEGPKALLQSAGRVNMRPGADGREYPVSELSENPTLQQILGGMMGGTPARVPSAPVRAPSGAVPPAGPTVISPDAQRLADQDAIRIIRQELANATDPATRAGLERELARFTAAQSRPGFPTATAAVTPGAGYGKTTEQKIADEVNKTRQLEQVKADVKPSEQVQNAITNAKYMDDLLGMAINHQGRETATGLSSILSPSNYIPGTKAKDFGVLLDQIKGASFQQAFASLKGAGAITEQEGKAATNAIARLNTSQSDGEFLNALQEYRAIVRKGLERLSGSTKPEGSWDSGNTDKRNLLPTLPQTAAKGTRARDTTTGEILEFNGTNWTKVR